MKQTCMTWGCSHDDGWYGIIREACEKLEPLIVQWMKDNPNDLEYKPRFSQVKEKYGTLCLYWTSATDEMYEITNAAEEKSATTCEQCGKPGKLRGRGWLYTSCLDCAKPGDTDNLEIVELADKEYKKDE